MRSALLLAAVVLALAAPAVYGQSTAPLSAIGTWNLTFNTDQGPMSGQLVLKKDADKIVGTITSDQAGTMPVEAQVDGKTLSVWFNYQGQNGPMPVEVAGTIDGDNVKGTFTLSGSAGGTFAGTREKDASQAAPSTPSKDAAAPSLTGTWVVSLQLDTMSATPTLVLKQDGEKLSGDYISEQYGKFPVTGTVKGNDVTLSFSMSAQGTAVDVTYSGTIEKDGSLKGSANYGDMMSGTFTATKKA
jgi:hypothetical protein